MRGMRHNRRGLARASASLSSSSSLGRLLSPFTTISPLQTCRGRGEALDALVPGKAGGERVGLSGRAGIGLRTGTQGCRWLAFVHPRWAQGSGGPHEPQGVRLCRLAIHGVAGVGRTLQRGLPLHLM